MKRLALLALIALALWVRLRVTFRPYEPTPDQCHCSDSFELHDEYGCLRCGCRAFVERAPDHGMFV